MIYYIIRFTVPGGGTLYAAWSKKGKGSWTFATEGITARRFKSERVAKRVAENSPPFQEMVAEGCTFEIVKITEEEVAEAT